MTDNLNSKVFKYAVSTSKGFFATFVFETATDAGKWMENDFQKLKKQEGLPQMEAWFFDLDGLRVGDKCHVEGEGADVYTIEGICQYSPNRYGFILDSGCTEEVYKCYATKQEEVEEDDPIESLINAAYMAIKALELNAEAIIDAEESGDNGHYDVEELREYIATNKAIAALTKALERLES